MTKSGSSTSKAKASKASKPAAKPRTNGAGKAARKTPAEVIECLFSFLCERHNVGIEEISKAELSNHAGYGNPRSAGFGEAIKALTSEGLVAKGSENDTFTLTEEGISKKPEKATPKTLSEYHDHFIGFLEKKVKGGSEKRVREVWEILADRQIHDTKDIAGKLGYKNPRSFGNTKIIPTMKEMNLVEDAGKGKVKMTDKAFPQSMVKDD
ncbi:expressed unknown protein [Seminavis robusta]|uniref:Uncharacterized protein n=1 Tax=Seminavis robusta TaxID=568900 RepID=A0A9N8DXZ5_9STRA|nr:expressed unknown protein [Seminavis robusta]|eukprot:Sro366_g127530.1 n/a (210) ;mRNA; r:6526-7155